MGKTIRNGCILLVLAMLIYFVAVIVAVVSAM